MATTTHPRLVRRERPRPVQGWTRTDTWFVLMMLGAIAFCMGLMRIATI
jgi:hypothetical protein